MAQPITTYPMKLSVDYPDRKLNRVTTAFRLFAVIPINIVLGLLGGAGGPVGWRRLVELLPICRLCRWWTCNPAPRVNASLPAKVSQVVV